MNIYIKRLLSRTVSCLLVLSLLLGQATPFVSSAHAQTQLVAGLPEPGVMLKTSPDFMPAVLKGIKVHPEDPFRLDFVIDTGSAPVKTPALKPESEKLIKYFLASLTVPSADLWVNLSPYEKDRIIPDAFGQTEMGRDLLEQDYILKQLTASLMYPDDELGRTFWAKVYAEAQAKFGTTDIPVDTFNKVWIVPDKAVVDVSGNVAFVAGSHLKVMLDTDYVAESRHPERSEGSPAQNENQGNNSGGSSLLARQEVGLVAQNDVLSSSISSSTQDLSRQIIREIIIPALEREVNEGENFAQLRQIYHAMILATWFKRNLKEGVLGRAYADQNKITGVDLADKTVKEQIYQQYLEAFKKGVYNFIREEKDPSTQEVVPRKYFSGGFEGERLAEVLLDHAMTSTDLATAANASKIGNLVTVSAGLRHDAAMTGQHQNTGRMPRAEMLKLRDVLIVPKGQPLKEALFGIWGADDPVRFMLEDKFFIRNNPGAATMGENGGPVLLPLVRILKFRLKSPASLRMVAEKFYGALEFNGDRVRRTKALNPGISDPDQELAAGTELSVAVTGAELFTSYLNKRFEIPDEIRDDWEQREPGLPKFDAAMTAELMSEPVVLDREVFKIAGMLKPSRVQVVKQVLEQSPGLIRRIRQERERLDHVQTSSKINIEIAGELALKIDFRQGVVDHVNGRGYGFAQKFDAMPSEFSFEEFLALQLRDQDGRSVEMRQVLEDVRIDTSRPLPLERSLRIYYDQDSSTALFNPYQRGPVVFTLKYDAHRRHIKTVEQADENDQERRKGVVPLLGAHFHPTEDTTASRQDVEMLMITGVPELIVSPSGKAELWHITDRAEVRMWMGSPEWTTRESGDLVRNVLREAVVAVPAAGDFSMTEKAGIDQAGITDAAMQNTQGHLVFNGQANPGVVPFQGSGRVSKVLLNETVPVSDFNDYWELREKAFVELMKDRDVGDLLSLMVKEVVKNAAERQMDGVGAIAQARVMQGPQGGTLLRVVVSQKKVTEEQWARLTGNAQLSLRLLQDFYWRGAFQLKEYSGKGLASFSKFALLGIPVRLEFERSKDGLVSTLLVKVDRMPGEPNFIGFHAPPPAAFDAAMADNASSPEEEDFVDYWKLADALSQFRGEGNEAKTKSLAVELSFTFEKYERQVRRQAFAVIAAYLKGELPSRSLMEGLPQDIVQLIAVYADRYMLWDEQSLKEFADKFLVPAQQRFGGKAVVVEIASGYGDLSTRLRKILPDTRVITTDAFMDADGGYNQQYADRIHRLGREVQSFNANDINSAGWKGKLGIDADTPVIVVGSFLPFSIGVEQALRSPSGPDTVIVVTGYSRATGEKLTGDGMSDEVGRDTFHYRQTGTSSGWIASAPGGEEGVRIVIDAFDRAMGRQLSGPEKDKMALIVISGAMGRIIQEVLAKEKDIPSQEAYIAAVRTLRQELMGLIPPSEVELYRMVDAVLGVDHSYIRVKGRLSDVLIDLDWRRFVIGDLRAFLPTVLIAEIPAGRSVKDVIAETLDGRAIGRDMVNMVLLNAVGLAQPVSVPVSVSDKAMTWNTEQQDLDAGDGRFGEHEYFLNKLGVVPGMRLLEVGYSTAFNRLGLVAAKKGAHYIGYELDPEKISFVQNWWRNEFNLSRYDGSAEVVYGDFGKDYPSRPDAQLQDLILMITGVLSDPVPNSDAEENLVAALHMLKPGGKLVVGSEGLQSEFRYTREVIGRVLELPEFKGKVELRPVDSRNLYLSKVNIFAVYEMVQIAPPAKSPQTSAIPGIGKAKNGGIDLGPDKLDLQTRGSAAAVNIADVGEIGVSQIVSINGLRPVILNITPCDLAAFVNAAQP